MIIDFLKNELKIRRITYDQLAAGTDISISTIKDIFRGKRTNPGIETIETMCKYLNVHIHAVNADGAYPFFDYLTKNLSQEQLALLDNFEKMEEHEKKVVFTVIKGFIDAKVK